MNLSVRYQPEACQVDRSTGGKLRYVCYRGGLTLLPRAVIKITFFQEAVMGFDDDLSEFGKKLVEGIKFVSFWLLKAVSFLAELEVGAPAFVQFVINIVAALMDRKEAGEITGAEAREIAVSETQAAFHGSGPVIPEPVIRQAIEAAVVVEWAKRGKSTALIDAVAVEKGYLLATTDDVKELAKRINPAWKLYGED